MDCDGNAVAGYNLYRRLSTEETYARLNSAPITGLTHTDTGLSAAPAGAIYDYALSAVDSSGEESVKSTPASVSTSDAGSSSSGGGGGGCFIASAGWDLSPDLLKPLGAMALLICLVLIGRRRRE